MGTSDLPSDGGVASGARSHPTEDRLASLAAAVGPLRRILAALAERLIETKAPERLCYARISDYARERLGLSARQSGSSGLVRRRSANSSRRSEGMPGIRIRKTRRMTRSTVRE
jgi:hypothetical protein